MDAVVKRCEAELHPSRDAKASFEMHNLPTRMAAGRASEDDVACGPVRSDVCLVLPFATLSRPGGKSHGNS